MCVSNPKPNSYPHVRGSGSIGQITTQFLKQKLLTSDSWICVSAFCSYVTVIADFWIFSEIFHHIIFFQLLALNTGKAVDTLVAKMRKGESVSLKFISQMIGSFCSGSKAGNYFDFSIICDKLSKIR